MFLVTTYSFAPLGHHTPVAVTASETYNPLQIIPVSWGGRNFNIVYTAQAH
jgi:hypothetical protein